MASMVFELEVYLSGKGKWSPILSDSGEDGRVRFDFYAYSESGLLRQIARERPYPMHEVRIVNGLDIVSNFTILPADHFGEIELQSEVKS